MPSRLMVRMALPTPAQLIAMRSGADSPARATASVTWSASVTSADTNLVPPDSSLARASPRSAFLSRIVTSAPAAVQATDRGLTQARRPAGDECGCSVDLHSGTLRR